MVLCNNEIAIPSLQQLFYAGVLKVVIVPEKNKELYSILSSLLHTTGIKLFTVNKKTLPSTIRAVASEMNITAAWIMTFPYIIPSSLLNVMPGGFINFHYGLLPACRGANPILSHMLNNDSQSGITIHVVDENVDTGPVVLQQKITIENTDSFGIQLQKLGMLAASMTLTILKFYSLSLTLPSVPQDESLAKYFKRPTAEELVIKWDRMTATEIIRLINACNPWNKGSGTLINNQVIRFTEAEIVPEQYTGNISPGTIVKLNEMEGLHIICSDKKIIRLNIFYLPQGFFSGPRLTEFGIKVTDRFTSETV